MLFFRKGEINAFSDKNLLPCKKCLKKSFREKEKDTGQNSEKERKSTRECISESKKKKKKSFVFLILNCSNRQQFVQNNRSNNIFDGMCLSISGMNYSYSARDSRKELGMFCY